VVVPRGILAVENMTKIRKPSFINKLKILNSNFARGIRQASQGSAKRTGTLCRAFPY